MSRLFRYTLALLSFVVQWCLNGGGSSRLACVRRNRHRIFGIILEDRSASTAENFAFSKAVLEEAGVDLTGARVAVVSNGFHLFRACLLAEAAGLDAVGVAARLPWWLDINYYLREPFALVKTWILDIAMKGVTI